MMSEDAGGVVSVNGAGMSKKRKTVSSIRAIGKLIGRL